MRSVDVHVDYESCDRAGLGGNFFVASISDDKGNDLTSRVDHGHHYASVDELRSDLEKKLGEPIEVRVAGPIDSQD
jgi:hypothetical protein